MSDSSMTVQQIERRLPLLMILIQIANHSFIHVEGIDRVTGKRSGARRELLCHLYRLRKL
ncbi:hypothetical protein [Peribacillus frigoritolerans]|uniref:hypothetical protein n=1 Tax=Peribacillus frigoritolerans TaxID=450367 RepID=UPI003393FAB5